MENIKHHLTDALLMGYATGTLPEAFNLIVATHVSLCDDCRAQLASFDAVGGEIVVSGSPVAMAEDALARAMGAIDGAAQEAPSHVAQTSGVFPAPLREYVSGDLNAVKWRKIGGGVSQMVLKTSKDATVRLLRIPAGAAMPDHGHHGIELTLVLQGAYVDEDDRFAAGDIEVADEDMHHTPVAEAGMDCICLAATDAPLKFNGFLPRLAQKFAGI